MIVTFLRRLKFINHRVKNLKRALESIVYACILMRSKSIQSRGVRNKYLWNAIRFVSDNAACIRKEGGGQYESKM